MSSDFNIILVCTRLYVTEPVMPCVLPVQVDEVCSSLTCLSLKSSGVDRGIEDLQLHLHPHLCPGVRIQAGGLRLPALLQGQVSIQITALLSKVINLAKHLGHGSDRKHQINIYLPIEAFEILVDEI